MPRKTKNLLFLVILPVSAFLLFRDRELSFETKSVMRTMRIDYSSESGSSAVPGYGSDSDSDLVVLNESLVSNFNPVHPYVNQSLVQNVFLDTSAVNVSYYLMDSKIAGALDTAGNVSYDYRYDVTSLRRDPPRFNDTDMETPCNRSHPHYDIMKAIDVMPPYPTNRRPVRLLCAVYSYNKSHPTRVQLLRETWAPKCDGFFTGSDTTDPTFDAVGVLKHGYESYRNMWNKVQGIWRYIYKNYFDDFDFFHLGGDDMWLIVENLRYFLNSDEIYLAQKGGNMSLPDTHQYPLFLGETITPFGDLGRLYNTGGPGKKELVWHWISTLPCITSLPQANLSVYIACFVHRLHIE